MGRGLSGHSPNGYVWLICIPYGDLLPKGGFIIINYSYYTRAWASASQLDASSLVSSLPSSAATVTNCDADPTSYTHTHTHQRTELEQYELGLVVE